MRNPEFRFISSYQGQTDYDYKGRRYGVRCFAHDDGHYNRSGCETGSYYEKGIEPLVGCLFHQSGGGYHDFPSPEALAIARQSYPEIVGARWLPGFTGIEYQEPRPALFRTKWGYVMPKWYAEDCGHTADQYEAAVS